MRWFKAEQKRLRAGFDRHGAYAYDESGKRVLAVGITGDGNWTVCFDPETFTEVDEQKMEDVIDA